ncbi:MAG: metallophosphatase [Candidatus Eremiobacteraeota bacterium]|nr:metallophosphatase [Candidatus Eremiobacteraeota bacterium]
MEQITIYHTNDLHNRYQLFSLLKQVPRDERTFLFDSGDALGGSSTLFYPREPVLSAMNDAGYTAMAMGNREFHYLRPVLALRAKSARFPILSANVKDLTGKSSHCWKDHLIVEAGTLRVGVMGLTPVQFPEHSFLTRCTGFLFIPPLVALREILGEFEALGVHCVIVLSHLGLRDDRELAEKTRGVDLILGGHSHRVLHEPLRVGKTLIMQAGSHGRYMGKCVIEAGERPLRLASYGLIPGGSTSTMAS